MEKKLPPSEDWPVWSPKLSMSNIKNAETIEEVEYEIGLLKQKDHLFTTYRPNATMQRRIGNALRYAREKIAIINQRNQQ
jgi:hypothetical protein